MKFIFTTIALKLIVIFSHAQFRPLHKLDHEFKAVINDQSKGEEKKWAVYSDTEMENKIGKLLPNDTVTVTGWSTWLYSIKTAQLQGFISSRALIKSHKIDSLSLVIHEGSEIDDSIVLKNRKQ